MIHTTLVLLRNTKNQVLLGYKARGMGQGRRNGFGGKFDPEQETPVDAAIRELHEETGIVYDPTGLQSAGYINFIRPNKTRPCHVFVGMYTGSFADSEEMTNIQWFGEKALPYDDMREADTILFPMILTQKAFISLDVYYNEKHKLTKREKRP